MKNCKYVYAIIRIDNYQLDDLKNFFTVKEIVFSIEEAKSEVERLNNLHPNKDVKYYWQTTRMKNHDGTRNV